jgi:hypothetical protein
VDSHLLATQTAISGVGVTPDLNPITYQGSEEAVQMGDIRPIQNQELTQFCPMTYNTPFT